MLAVSGGVVLGLAVWGALALRSGHDGLRPKRGVIPTLAVASGVHAAAGGAIGARSGNAAGEPTISKTTAAAPASMDRDLRTLPFVPANPLPNVPELEPPAMEPPALLAKQPSATEPVPRAHTPTVNVLTGSQSFDAMTHDADGAGYPPDTNGDVGPAYYIQTVNTSIGIYTKIGGAAAAPVTFNAFWSGAGTGTPCDTTHNGDPTVVYDPMADRWIIADFSWTDLQNGPYYECVAVSKTSNPVSGGWWLYAIRADDAAHPWLNDYPKMGVWPDGLYITYNMFDCLNPLCSSSTYEEVRAQAVDRTALEAGTAPVVIAADLGSTSYFSLAPSNMRTGAGTPPAGRENLLVSESGTLFAWEVWKFHADYVGAGSTFNGPTNVSQTSYVVAPSTIPSGGNQLDTLRERVMVQNQYTNISGAESLWVNHTTRTTTTSTAPVGIQWAQINVTLGSVVTTPVQQQRYGDTSGTTSTGVNRWMGSLAVDKAGNMALGYSAGNATCCPSIRYAGRIAGDGLGTLQPEATLIAGTGSQTNTCGTGTCIRWGDYSGMTLDPDGCTFWYTTEYYDAASGSNWRTRVGSFTFAPTNCTPAPPTAVSVGRFVASRTKQGVVVTWRTGTEAQILGFNVWRQSRAGRWTKLNPALVAAGHAGQSRGATYRFLDRTALGRAPYNYRLQVVAPTGKRSWYGLGTVAAAR